MRWLAGMLCGAAVLVLALSGCGSPALPGSGGGTGSPEPTPGAGSITGKLVSQRSDGSQRAPIGGQTVGVFRQVVIPGKPQQHPPQPLVTSVTEANGSFAFHGLDPGDYFVTVAGSAPPSVSGHWVKLTPAHGASVLLIHCTNCPGPL